MRPRLLKEVERLVDAAPLNQLTLRGKDIEGDAQRPQVVLDPLQHGVGGEAAGDPHDFVFRLARKRIAIFLLESLAYRFQVVAGVEPFQVLLGELPGAQPPRRSAWPADRASISTWAPASLT